MNLAERIKGTRLLYGLSQHAAAIKWGFTQQSLSLWERGITAPRGLYRKRLEQVFVRADRKFAAKA